MKKFFLLLLSVISFASKAQNIEELFYNMPFPFLTCEETFKSAEVEWESMLLDNDSIFKRAKSWAPGGDLKTYSLKLEKLVAFIERASEDNSFSLSAPPTIAKEVMISLENLEQIRTNIVDIWNTFRNPVGTLNADFYVPNELDNGCDQIQHSITILNDVSIKLISQLKMFNEKIKSPLSEFQLQFNELNKIKHPMINNQILDEVSNLINILNEISNTLNFHYKNMVETRMAWNNAFCK